MNTDDQDGGWPPVGATGEFPQGKIHPDDEGEIQLAVAWVPDKGVVVVDFGTPVTWLALPPDQALGLADLIRRHALKGLTGGRRLAT